MKIRVENLTREFGTTRAVDDLSFTFSSGQIFAFVGPNGAGKTTTMRIMATLDEPDAGEVYFDGTSVTRYPEEARRLLGFMPDNLPAPFDVVVHEYLDFFARAFGLKGRQRSVVLKELIEFTGLGPLRSKTLRSLSKGMKQRVSLARALVHDPKLLILDEPAAGLDPRARVELRELMLALAERGKAVLISSHILNELEEVSDGAVIIERGRLLRAGTMDEIHRSGLGEDPAGESVLWAISAIEATDRLLEDLLEHPAVAHAARAGRIYEAGILGGDEEASALLAHLIARDHRVLEFRKARAGLEKLFMNVTKGEVQ